MKRRHAFLSRLTSSLRGEVVLWAETLTDSVSLLFFTPPEPVPDNGGQAPQHLMLSAGLGSLYTFIKMSFNCAVVFEASVILKCVLKIGLKSRVGRLYVRNTFFTVADLVFAM